MITDRRVFLKQLGLGTAGLGLSLAIPEWSTAAPSIGRRLPRSHPEAQGVSSRNILAFLDALAVSKHEFHSLMIVRHGHAVTEGWWRPYRAEVPQMMYSMSKSFTSTGIGFAVAEKRLRVDDKVISFFPDEVPSELSDNLKALRVKDLLTMSVGHAQDSTGSLWPEENWVKKFLSLPIANPPGTRFLYNSGATYMLSAIVQKVTGQKLIDYLRPRLFGPLGIEDVSWETCPRGMNTGGWGLKIQTEGLAKFGQLYLQRGEWNRKQLLPGAWVDEATSFKIQQPAPDLEKAKQQSDWHQGYCYQFWRCRHNAYRGDGAFGQYTIVMPEQDAVVAITSETSNMQGVLDLVWEHLLAGMHSAPLPREKALESELEKRLSELALTPPKSQRTSPVVGRISGQAFNLKGGAGCPQTALFQFAKNRCLFTVKDEKGEHGVDNGMERWVEGETSMPGTPPTLTQGKPPAVSKVAASGTWKDEITFEMTWRYYETPHHDTVTCKFEGNKVRIEFLDSMTAMAPGRKDKRAAWEGELAARRA